MPQHIASAEDLVRNDKKGGNGFPLPPLLQPASRYCAMQMLTRFSSTLAKGCILSPL